VTGSTRQPLPGVYLLDDWAARSTNFSFAQGSVVHVGWGEIEPADGRFDFKRIDDWLARLAPAGKEGAVGIYLRCADDAAGEDGCAPPWALAWQPVMVGSKPRLNYLDGQVQQAAAQMVDALARHYAADARLSHIEIDLGFAGSASPCPIAADAPGQEQECQAYQQAYDESNSGWEAYMAALMDDYAGSFEAAGGFDHVPLQVSITGKFMQPDERDVIVKRALQHSFGLHDQALAASFPTGENQASGCSVAGSQSAGAPPSHWQLLAQYWPELPISVEMNQHPRKSELSLTDEENVWWSVLNALDKHASVMYAEPGDIQWTDAWQFFARYAGRTAQTTQDAWIALRGDSGAWCGDTGDYEWYLHRRGDAAGASTVMASASQQGGRVGNTWEGAYSRSTDIADGRPALYFDVDDGFVYGGSQVAMVEVTYWDGPPQAAGATWELDYDGTDSPSEAAGTVTLQGTGQWLSHSFVLLDATFRKRLPDADGQPGNDLRLLATGSSDVQFHMLRLRVLTRDPGSTPVATATPTVSQLAAASATPLPSGADFTIETAGRPKPTPDGQDLASDAPISTPWPDTDSPASSPAATGIDVVRYQIDGHPTVVTDTYIDADHPNDNFGVANCLMLDSGGHKLALLRFDLSDIPSTARVVSAWLELTVVGRDRPGQLVANIYPLHRAWDANQANWRQAAAGQLWAAAGLQPGADFDLDPAATVQLPGESLAQTSLTNLVQSWIRRPADNEGILLAGSGDPDMEYYLASSEWREAGARPRLRIRLAPGAGVVSGPVATPLPTGGASLASGSFGDASGIDAVVVALLYAAPATPTVAATARRAPTPLPRRTPVAPNLPTIRIVAVQPASDGEAGRSDIVAYVYGPGGASPPCNWTATLRLWGAAGQSPVQALAVGSRVLRTIGKRTFPAWVFKAVDVAGARGSENLLQLFATADGVETIHNIMTIGANEGTYYPQPQPPAKTGGGGADPVDASIEILWPHGGSAISDTSKANLSVALFDHGTRDVLPVDAEYTPTVLLHWSVNDGPDQAGTAPPAGRPRLIQAPWLTYYLWDFPDVDVSAARQPGHYLNFWVDVPGVTAYTNVWSHGFGPRPEPDAPLPATSCR
jgi:hypothetical protein